MIRTRRLLRYAKRLIQSTCQKDGSIDPTRITHLITYLSQENPYGKRDTRRLIKIIARQSLRDIAARTLTVESSTAMRTADRSDLLSAVEKKLKKPIAQTIQIQNPDLIAGIRIRVGDIILDHSIAGILHQWKKGIVHG